MRFNVIVLVLLVIFLTSCSWSPEQEEVLEAFDSLRAAVDMGNWDGVWDICNTPTRNWLDSAAVALTEQGLPFYGSGADLLKVTYPDFFNFDGEVSMILMQGNVAELRLHSPPEGSSSLEMTLDETGWKIDLHETYRDSIQGQFAGSFLPEGILASPLVEKGAE